MFVAKSDLKFFKEMKESEMKLNSLKDKIKCKNCGSYVSWGYGVGGTRLERIHIHHVTRKHYGVHSKEDNRPSNIQRLCRVCHRNIKSNFPKRKFIGIEKWIGFYGL